MNCDPKIAELLPLYANGSLKDDEKKKVEEHLKACSKCQKELAQTKWLLEGVEKYGEVLLTGHIDSEKLVLYAHSPNELKESERSIIEGHLKDCSECADELKLLQESTKEFEESTISPEREVSFGTQITDWFKSILDGLSWLVRRPAFAYVIILLLIYPAYLGLFRARIKVSSLFDRRFTDQAVLIGKELVLSDQTRGIDYKTPEVYLDTTINILQLRIRYPIDTTFATNYEVIIKDSTGSVIWVNNDWRKYGMKGEERFWVFELNPAVLPSGLLEVHIQEHEPDQPSQMPAAIYQFRLRKGK